MGKVRTYVREKSALDRLLDHPGYRPDVLLSRAATQLGCRSSAALARRLGFSPSQLSRAVHREGPITRGLAEAIARETGWPVGTVWEIAGVPDGPPGAE